MTVVWNTLLRIWSLRWNYLFSSTFWFLGWWWWWGWGGGGGGGNGISPPSFFFFSGSVTTTSTVKDFKAILRVNPFIKRWTSTKFIIWSAFLIATDRKICAPFWSVRAIWRLRIVIGKCEPLNQYVAGGPCQAYERVRLDDLYRRLFEDWLATCSAAFGLGGVAPPTRFLFGVRRDNPFFIDFNFLKLLWI